MSSIDSSSKLYPLILFYYTDKTDPNYIDTVIGVFMEQAEGINVEELQYRMLMKAESVDDWHAQITKMKLKLLDWQKNPAPAQAPSRPQAPSGSK